MKDMDKIMRILAKTFIVFFVIIVGYWGNYFYKEIRFKVENKKTYKRWETEGMSPITRSVNKKDTLRIDTIR